MLLSDWVVEQGSIINTTSDGEPAIAVLLTESGGGTLLSSTRYVHYGQITARCECSFFQGALQCNFSFRSCPVKTGRWAGVVTAFITMSSIKDEIDWEFPGNQTTTGQTNYFWQGVIREFLAVVSILRCVDVLHVFFIRNLCSAHTRFHCYQKLHKLPV